LRDTSKLNAADLLEWYDNNARVMPWRIGPVISKTGYLPDPYHIWLSEVMLQQTTVAAVKSYFETFVTRWPRVENLAAAADGDVMAAWAGLGYYARARNLLKCARVVAKDLNGAFPNSYATLLKLPGIGPYTAAAIAAIAFNQRAVVLDGNVERVMARLFRVEEPLPRSKEHLRELADRLTPDTRCGDYAQAVMDLGATICTPRSPACGICPWKVGCAARTMGDAGRFPLKSPKVPIPVRQGLAFVAVRQDGAVLLERRPDSGLLGGMLCFPGTGWNEEAPIFVPPIAADWHEAGEVRHTFTHFHLRLAVWVARDFNTAIADNGFVAFSEFAPTDLPTVMRKVWAMASVDVG
jgi:A/G-specific adenine glycosylase